MLLKVFFGSKIRDLLKTSSRSAKQAVSYFTVDSLLISSLIFYLRSAESSNPNDE